MNHLGKNAAYSLLYRLGNVLFPLLSSMYLARVLGPEPMGRVAAVRNTVSYFVMLAALGIYPYGLRETARCREDGKLLGKLVSELLVLRLAAGTVCVIVFLLLFCLPGKEPLYGIFLLELLFSLTDVEWLLEGQEEYSFLAVRTLGIRLASFLALVLLVRGPEDLYRYGVILCLATGGNHLLGLLHARVRPTLRSLEPKRHVKPVLILMLSSLAASIYSKVDISMLHILAEDAAVAYYTTAYKVISLVLTAATAVTAIFFPRLSRSSGNGFQSYVSGALSLVLVITLPAALGLMLVAEDVMVVLFGPAYLPAAGTLNVMAPMVVIRGCGDLLCYQAIISSGKEKSLIPARIWAGLANILLNGLLIPRWGHLGAAAATLVSESLVNGLLLPTGLAAGKPRLCKHLLVRSFWAAAAMAAAVAAIQWLAVSPARSLGLSVILGAAIYSLCLGYQKTKRDLEVYNGTEAGSDDLTV